MPLRVHSYTLIGTIALLTTEPSRGSVGAANLRNECLSPTRWSAVLGEMATGVGADGLYPLITSGTAALA